MPMGFSEHRIADLNVAICGPPDAPPLVLIHGLGATWRVWQPVLDALADRFRVIAIDLPGFGRSPELPDRSFEFAAVSARITGLLDALSIEQCVLIGHSLGGGVAAWCAAEYPDRVRRLVLVAPAGFRRVNIHPPRARLWRSPIAHRVFRHGLVALTPAVAASRRVRTRAFRGLFYDATTVTRQDAVALLLGSRRGRSTGKAGTLIVRGDLQHRLERLTMPTLLIWGDSDRVVSARPAAELVARIANADLLLLEHTGHMPMHERTEQFVHAVTEFALPHPARLH